MQYTGSIRRFLVFLVFLLFYQPPTQIFAQYVRKENFRTEHDRRLKYALDDWVSYTSSNRFSSMTVGTHYIYIGTKGGGILRYHIYDNYWDYPFTTSNGLPSNQVENVVFDPKTSFLWAVTPNDVAIYNFTSREWIRRSETPGWPYQFPETGTSQDPNDIRKERFLDREALFNLPGFFANGSFSITGEWTLIDDFTFDEYPIVGYLRDRFDRIWFLVDGFGIGEGQFFSRRVNFYRVGLPDFSPRAIAYQGDDLWFGGIGKERQGVSAIALWPYNQAGWHYFQARRINRLPRDDVNDIVADGDSVWFATEFGVLLYDAAEDKWRNWGLGQGVVSHTVWDVEILGNYLYAATDQGISRINRFSGKGERIKDLRFSNLPTYRLALQNDTLWAATFRGIFRYINTIGDWELVEAKSAIQDINVTAVDVYQNEVWFAAHGGIFGLNLDTDEWQSFNQIAFEIDYPYMDIKVNDKSVWVATPNGLLKYDKIRQDWRLFTRQDGLLSNICYQLLLDGDYIWIANELGYTQFYWNSPRRSD